MKTFIPILFILTAIQLSFAQYPIQFAANPHVWDAVVEPIHPEERYYEIEHLQAQELYQKEFAALGLNNDDFHIVDYNNDGHVDLVYDGYFNLDKCNHVVFFRGYCEDWCGYYTLDKEFYGRMNWVKSRQENGFAFQIIDFPDCGGTTVHLETYEIESKISDPKFELSAKEAYVIWNTPPAALTMSVPFEVAHESLELLSHPENEHSSIEESFMDTENARVIATYGAKSTGVALFSSRDSHNEEWWFVLMNNNKKPDHVMFEDGHNSKAAAKFYGWVSAKFIRSH